MGTKSDTNSLAIDSGDEWDKMEVGVFSCCPTATAKIGPTWVEVHAAAQEEVTNKQDSAWEDIVSRELPGGVEKEDWGRKEGGHPTMGPAFDDTTIEEEGDEEEVIVESEAEVVVGSGTKEKLEQPLAREPLAEELGETTVDLGNREVVWSHTGEDDMISVSLPACNIKRRTDAEGQYSFKDTAYPTHFISLSAMARIKHSISN